MQCLQYGMDKLIRELDTKAIILIEIQMDLLQFFEAISAEDLSFPKIDFENLFDAGLKSFTTLRCQCMDSATVS